jgi:hypothetical protein
MPQRPPVVSKPEYENEFIGYAGTLGAGANAYIRFLQTALTPNDLEKTTLIQNIKGSESWDVKDLFQRDVDEERVTEQITPYFNNPDLVKFFNPLTMLLLPMQSDSDDAQKIVEYVAKTTRADGSFEYEDFERVGHYKFEVCKNPPAYSKVKWRGSSTKLVAIDGQHRLNTLTRIAKDNPSLLKGWHIPVIIIGVFQEKNEDPVPNLLEVVRKIFLYINTEAKTVSESREILLNDESVNSICVQVLVQVSHVNDCEKVGNRKKGMLPLMFYDWRGATKNLNPAPSPGAFVGLPEVRRWFSDYITGEDGSDRQERALGLVDEAVPISVYRGGSDRENKDKKLSPAEAIRVRDKFREDCYQGVSHLLENFKPFEIYAFKIREMEIELLGESDIARYAFAKLRFGTHRAPEEIVSSVNSFYKDRVINLGMGKAKAHIHGLITHDIGMRAVMYAFGKTKIVYDEKLNDGETSTWQEYSEWFVVRLNQAYDDNWFLWHTELEDGSRDHKKMAELLTFISHNGMGSVENYRFEKQKQGFGAWLCMLIMKYGAGVSSDLLNETVEEQCEALEPSLKRGFRRKATQQLKGDNFSGTSEERADKIKEMTERKTKAQFKKIRIYFCPEED